MRWLHSQRQEGVQDTMMQFSGNGEAEDEHKERDRICDSEDAVLIWSSDDEADGESLIQHIAPDCLETNGKSEQLFAFSFYYLLNCNCLLIFHAC